METRSNPTRRVSSKKGTNGIKALIMAASLGITLGGWGILASEQVPNTQASAQALPGSASTTGAATQLSQGANSTTSIRRSSGLAASTSPLARTRSSR